jgi:SOS response regulatory protein OraA/RecX
MFNMKAKITALRLLSIKSRSRLELKKKLLFKGFSSSEADEAVAECERLGFLNDEEEAKRRSSSLRARGYGSRLIALKLKTQGLEAVKEASQDRETMRALLQKTSWKKKEKHKCIAALQRRGFDLETILEVVSSK